MMVAIEQVEALDVDARRRGGKILCRGASRIPNLALVRGLGLRFHEFFKLRGLHSRSSRHTAYLHIDINSAVSIVEIAAHMHVSALSSVCKGTLRYAAGSSMVNIGVFGRRFTCNGTAVCRDTISLAMASPSPAPPRLVARAASRR